MHWKNCPHKVTMHGECICQHLTCVHISTLHYDFMYAYCVGYSKLQCVTEIGSKYTVYSIASLCQFYSFKISFSSN